MNKKIIYLAISIILICSIFTYIDIFKGESKKEVVNTVRDEVTIMATGDIMYHMITYVNNYNDNTNKYDFSSFYKKMEPYINEADIMIGNYESTSCPEKLYSGFPSFNTPPESIEYLKSVGFDVLSTANNHCIDTGVDGIISTINIMDKNNIKHFGTYKEDTDRGIILEKNNIKVGFLGYSESFNGLDKIIPKDKQFMISKFNRDVIKKDIDTLREKGADFIIVYPHWGVEYSKNPSDFQKFMNQELLNLGADAILGSHPHRLQRTEENIINKERKFTIYSMGNSISNQRKKYMKIDGTETGVFVKIKISKDKSDNKAKIESVDLLPTYVRVEKKDKKYYYEVVALKDYIEGGIYRQDLTEKEKEEIDKNYKDALDILYSVGD